MLENIIKKDPFVPSRFIRFVFLMIVYPPCFVYPLLSILTLTVDDNEKKLLILLILSFVLWWHSMLLLRHCQQLLSLLPPPPFPLPTSSGKTSCIHHLILYEFVFSLTMREYRKNVTKLGNTKIHAKEGKNKKSTTEYKTKN